MLGDVQLDQPLDGTTQSLNQGPNLSRNLRRCVFQEPG
jgi:hypothetical protein